MGWQAVVTKTKLKKCCSSPPSTASTTSVRRMWQRATPFKVAQLSSVEMLAVGSILFPLAIAKSSDAFTAQQSSFYTVMSRLAEVSPYVAVAIGILLTVAGSCCMAFGSVIMKIGMEDGHRNGSIPSSHVWWGGLGAYSFGALLHVLGLIFAPASLLAPLNSLGLVANAVAAVGVLGEHVGAHEAIGTAFTIIGVALCSICSFLPHDDSYVVNGTESWTDPIYLSYLLLCVLCWGLSIGVVQCVRANAEATSVDAAFQAYIATGHFSIPNIADPKCVLYPTLSSSTDKRTPGSSFEKWFDSIRKDNTLTDDFSFSKEDAEDHQHYRGHPSAAAQNFGPSSHTIDHSALPDASLATAVSVSSSNTGNRLTRSNFKEQRKTDTMKRRSKNEVRQSGKTSKSDMVARRPGFPAGVASVGTASAWIGILYGIAAGVVGAQFVLALKEFTASLQPFGESAADFAAVHRQLSGSANEMHFPDGYGERFPSKRGLSSKNNTLYSLGILFNNNKSFISDPAVLLNNSNIPIEETLKRFIQPLTESEKNKYFSSVLPYSALTYPDSRPHPPRITSNKPSDDSLKKDGSHWVGELNTFAIEKKRKLGSEISALLFPALGSSRPRLPQEHACLESHKSSVLVAILQSLVCIAMAGASIVLQMYYLNCGLAAGEATSVVPAYYVSWTIFGALGGFAKFHEASGFSRLQVTLFLVGLAITLGSIGWSAALQIDRAQKDMAVHKLRQAQRYRNVSMEEGRAVDWLLPEKFRMGVPLGMNWGILPMVSLNSQNYLSRTRRSTSTAGLADDPIRTSYSRTYSPLHGSHSRQKSDKGTQRSGENITSFKPGKRPGLSPPKLRRSRSFEVHQKAPDIWSEQVPCRPAGRRVTTRDAITTTQSPPPHTAPARWAVPREATSSSVGPLYSRLNEGKSKLSQRLAELRIPRRAEDYEANEPSMRTRMHEGVEMTRLGSLNELIYNDVDYPSQGPFSSTSGVSCDGRSRYSNKKKRMRKLKTLAEIQFEASHSSGLPDSLFTKLLEDSSGRESSGRESSGRESSGRESSGSSRLEKSGANDNTNHLLVPEDVCPFVHDPLDEPSYLQDFYTYDSDCAEQLKSQVLLPSFPLAKSRKGFSR